MSQELEIGNNIKQLRDKEGLNQREFAEKIGLFSPDYLRKIERGDLKEPKYSFLIAIADYCHVSVDYILRGHESFYSKQKKKLQFNMKTESAKSALLHLNNCARSLEELDRVAYPAIQALEREVSKLEDPEIRQAMEAFQSSNMVSA